MEENLNTSVLILGCVFVPGDTVLCDCLRYYNHTCSYQRLILRAAGENRSKHTLALCLPLPIYGVLVQNTSHFAQGSQNNDGVQR